MSQFIQTRFDFSTPIAGVGSGGDHTTQRITRNATTPGVFNEYERLFNQIAKVIGDYSFSDVFSAYAVSKNTIGDAIRYVYSDYRALTTSLETRKYDKQGGLISGNVQITGTFHVNGDVAYDSPAVFNSSFTVGGASRFDNTIAVYGILTSYSSINIKFDSTFQNSLTVVNTLTTNKVNTTTLSCTKASTFGGLITADSLKVANSSKFQSSIEGTSASFSGDITSTYTAGPPFIVASTDFVANLNVDLLDGAHAGNSAGDVSLSNGTLCLSLNADLLDGAHAGNSAGSIALSNGARCVNLNADMLDSYHASIASAASSVVVRDVNSGITAAAGNFTGALTSSSIATTGKISAGNIYASHIDLVGNGSGSSSITVVLPATSYFSIAANYEVIVIPASNPIGNLGELYVTKYNGSFAITVSGVYLTNQTVTFSFIAIGN